jgi:hypothetical protein
MKLNRTLFVGCLLLGCSMLPRVALGDQDVIIAANAVSTLSTADTTLGDYYVINFDVPEGIAASDLLVACNG